MKKTIIISTLCIAMIISLSAQEKPRHKELGLTFSNLDNFGLVYFTGTEKSLWRFSTLFITGGVNKSTADSLVSTDKNSGIGLAVGREIRKTLSDKFDLRVGADASFRFLKGNREVDDKSVYDLDRSWQYITYMPGVNFVLGINYRINDKLTLGAEVQPYINFYFRKTTSSLDNAEELNETKHASWRYGLTNSSVLLTIACRI